MLIGKAGAATTSLCTADAESVTVRGHDLCADLMGQKTFTEFFFLSVTGQLPTEQQRYFVDLLLIAIAEHGLTPSAQAARMTLAAGPDALQAALAAGILGCGTVILGAADDAGRLLVTVRQTMAGDDDMRAAAGRVVGEIRASRGKLPGFGHPLHRPLDPRAERIFALARERGVAGPHCDIAEALREAVAEAWDKPLTLNVSLAIAAVLLDLDFPQRMIKAIPLLARAAGLLGHLAEEQETPIGFLMAARGEEAITYVPQEKRG